MTPQLEDGSRDTRARLLDERRVDGAFRRTLVVAVAFPLLALAALASVSLWQLDHLLDEFAVVDHSDRVIAVANETQRGLIDMETGIRGYLLANVDDFLEPYRQALSRVRESFAELQPLVADNPTQLAELTAWRQRADAWIALAEGEVRTPLGREGMVARSLDRKARMDEVRSAFSDFVDHAEVLRSTRSTRAQRAASFVFRSGLVLTLFIGVACALFFARQLFSVSRTFREALGREQTARAAAETSERRYSSLVAATTAVVWTAAPEGTFITPQLSWAQYTGQTWEEYGGRGWLAVFVAEDRDRVRSAWDDALAAHATFMVEARLRHAASDTHHWTVVRAVPVAGTDGAVREWIGTVTDVDDRRRAELERDQLLEREQRARTAAEGANRAKDQFLAMVSHELRNPLSPILAWSRLLQSPDLPEDKRLQGLQAIERGARSQAQLIEDLLDISRIVSGKLRLDVRPLDLGAVVQAAIETVRPSADARQIRLSVVLDPRSGPIAGDPERLQQVAWNLLSNAVKFTPRGGRVQVQLARVNSHVELTVSDSGEGIAPEMVPHVFERFWQADSGTTRERGGLGLGLAIVRHLIELHGGTVSVHSEGVGRGTLFRVHLPLMAVAGDADDPMRRHPTGEDGTTAALASLERVRVLVVDDEDDSVAVVQELLTLRGAEVRTASSTSDALAILDAWSPDVLVSDIGMPEEDGYALIGRVRARAETAGGAVPAVALTAYARVDDRIRVLAAGFDMHVAKPIDPAELVAVIARLAHAPSGA